MVQVDAFSCGTPTGGVTVQCDDIDTYTLLNLETLVISQKTIAEAQKLDDWDIGFKRTDVIINSRSFGRGDVDGALIFKNNDFFDDKGKPNYQKLMDAYTRGGELEAFERVGRLVGS